MKSTNPDAGCKAPEIVSAVQCLCFPAGAEGTEKVIIALALLSSPANLTPPWCLFRALCVAGCVPDSADKAKGKRKVCYLCSRDTAGCKEVVTCPDW